MEFNQVVLLVFFMLFQIFMACYVVLGNVIRELLRKEHSRSWYIKQLKQANQFSRATRLCFWTANENGNYNMQLKFMIILRISGFFIAPLPLLAYIVSANGSRMLVQTASKFYATYLLIVFLPVSWYSIYLSKKK